MSNHTPGKWEVKHITGEEHDWYQIEDQEGNTIARVYDNGDETKANAYLIAESTELLEALKFIIKRYEATPFVEDAGTEPLNIARNAIADFKKAMDKDE